MNIAFVINQTHKEEAAFTTTILALKALQRGHDIFYIGLADFHYTDYIIAAHVRHIKSQEQIHDSNALIQLLRNTEKKLVPLTKFDIVWLRFDPVLDMVSRPWAAPASLQFSEIAQRQGVWIINNPEGLAKASNKLYLENFDESIRPKTLVTRSYEDVVKFFHTENKKIILKPLKGSGGKNVFLIDENNQQNLKQTVEAIARDGYVIAQEYLPQAAGGDIRFFLLDGKPILINGKYAAVHRVPKADELRSNIHQGASLQEAYIDINLLKMVDKVADKLKNDGMYFVGLDIVGDKIMEINVFSPGALYHAEKIAQEDFSGFIIADLERRVENNK